MVTSTPHHASHELAKVVLRLRDDLTFFVRETNGRTVYVIEDELASRFYRIGLAECTFVSRLDGQNTFADALGHTAATMKADGLSETEAAELCRWLIEAGLASTSASESSERLLERTETARNAQRAAALNPMFVRIPLGNPQPVMKSAAAAWGWLFEIPFLFVWATVVAWGLLCVSIASSDLASMGAGVVSQHNWIWLLGTTLGLKLLHEFGHGIACQRFGGYVRECGVMFVLFVPLPYVDVTSSWRIESRFKRVLVSAAGMYLELLVAAVAAIVWYHSESVLVRQHAFNVMFSAGVVTLLFNANPLMRFDGYYILTDFLEQPNLASHGQLLFRSLGRMVFFALPGHSPEWPEGRVWLVLGYGIAAFAWRIVVAVGMILAADMLFFGAGVLVAAFALFTWLLLPLFRLMRFLTFGDGLNRPSRGRFLVVSAVVLLLSSGVAYWRWQPNVSIAAVIDFDPVIDVRPASGGFLDRIHVSPGERIRKGDLLYELRNPELVSHRDQLQTELLATRQRSRKSYQAKAISAWQVDLELATSLEERLQQVCDRIDSLKVFAPMDGVVLTSETASLTGTWVAAGSSVLQLGDEKTKTVVTAVPENIASEFRERVGSPVDVFIDGNGIQPIAGTLVKINPQASLEVPHPSLAASYGGRVDVKQVPNGNEVSVRFAEPHVMARVQLSQASTFQSRAGQTATVKIKASEQRVIDLVRDKATRWWHRRQIALRESWVR